MVHAARWLEAGEQEAPGAVINELISG